jgi:hypothetical protein
VVRIVNYYKLLKNAASVKGLSQKNVLEVPLQWTERYCSKGKQLDSPLMALQLGGSFCYEIFFGLRKNTSVNCQMIYLNQFSIRRLSHANFKAAVISDH